MDALAVSEELGGAPLDLVEQVLIEEDYPYERGGEEARFAVEGAWSDHQLWFAWRPESRVLQLCVALDLRAPQDRRSAVCDLLARINERLGIGHFDFTEEGSLIYRCVLPVLDAGLTQLQVSTMIAVALEAADHFYPAFNFLIWAGKSAEEAVQAAMFDTLGEA